MTQGRRLSELKAIIVARNNPNFDWDLLDRLLADIVYRNDCWIRGTDHSLYSKIKDGNKYRSAHRVSYELFSGKRLEHFGCHCCDVPACINPDHIFDGTPSDNVRDAIAKGRMKGFYIESSDEKKEKKRIIREQGILRGKLSRSLRADELDSHIKSSLGLAERLASLTRN